MPGIIAALFFIGFSAFLALSGPNTATTNPFMPTIAPPFYAGSQKCLDPDKINMDVKLENIPLAQVNQRFMVDDNCPSQDPSNPNSSCKKDTEDGNADTDTYYLASSAIKLEQIWPNPPTTRLMKQKWTNMPAEWEDRIYRASCNDWCWLSIPFGGTFHCDFVYYLNGDLAEVTESRVEMPGEPAQLYPKDCDFSGDTNDCPTFNVYMRKVDGEFNVPPIIRAGNPLCENKTTTLNFYDLQRPEIVNQAQAQTTPDYISFDGHRWILDVEKIVGPTPADPALYGIRYIYKANIRSPNPPAPTPTPPIGGGRIDYPYPDQKVTFRGKDYQASKNLDARIHLRHVDDFLYLSDRDELEAIDKSTNPRDKLNYFRFRASPETIPQGKSLQLGTFFIPPARGWWTLWIDESKPAIYLYPEKETVLDVKLAPAGELTVSDPLYDPQTGWQNVKAYPDGTLIYQGKKYPYLYYEAKLEKVFVKPQGFTVAGKDLVAFFKETLPQLGLNQKETSDFIVYWMTRLSTEQPYYFIHFLDVAQIETLEPLSLSVKPDTEIRLRAYFKPLKNPQSFPQQQLPIVPKRTKFTLVEWGGILDE